MSTSTNKFRRRLDASRQTVASTDRSASFWATIAAIATCVATLLAAWAAWETRSSANEAAKATRASVWIQMLTEYGSPDMLAAMKDLRAWQRSGPDFSSRFQSLLLSKSDRALVDQVDGSRRRVGQFFNKLRVLCELRVIDETDVRLTWDSGTYKFVSDVLIPIERAKLQTLLVEGSIDAKDKAEGDRRYDHAEAFYQRVFTSVSP